MVQKAPGPACLSSSPLSSSPHFSLPFAPPRGEFAFLPITTPFLASSFTCCSLCPETFLSKATASTLCLADSSSSLKSQPICLLWEAFRTPQGGRGAPAPDPVSLHRHHSTRWIAAAIGHCRAPRTLPDAHCSVGAQICAGCCELCADTKHSGNSTRLLRLACGTNEEAWPAFLSGRRYLNNLKQIQ